MANIKKIQRNSKFEIRMSEEEKKFFFKYAEDIGINPTKLARNILMNEAKSIVGKAIYKPVVQAYKNYLEVTKQFEALKNIEEQE